MHEFSTGHGRTFVGYRVNVALGCVRSYALLGLKGAVTLDNFSCILSGNVLGLGKLSKLIDMPSRWETNLTKSCLVYQRLKIVSYLLSIIPQLRESLGRTHAR